MVWIRWFLGLFLSFYLIDIDYLVFSDASKSIWNGASPYDRSTYRYTPLLAILLLPTLWFPLFGKWLFLACDHLGALFLKKILILNKEPEWYADVYLWNPFMMAISARGSSESLLLVLVLWTLLLVKEKRIVWAGILFGFSVHLKLYPIIYAWPYCLYLAEKCSFYSLVTSKKVWLFAFVSSITFLSLFSLMYHWYCLLFLIQ
jgi:phosphatidylinositol glycan class M